MKEHRDEIFWTVIFFIVVLFKNVFKYIVNIKNSAVNKVKNRVIAKEKKASKKKEQDESTRKKRVGSTINPNDPWSGLSN